MAVITETEAMERWCPFVRNGMFYNIEKLERTPPWSFCVGSKCMAWRMIEDGEIQKGFCGLGGSVTPIAYQQHLIMAHPT